jgi:DNA repair protein RecO (recombination protein O)
MPNPVTVELLDALLTGDWDRAETSQGTNRREGSGLVAALLQWHLERGLRSLALVDRSDSTAHTEMRPPPVSARADTGPGRISAIGTGP